MFVTDFVQQQQEEEDGLAWVDLVGAELRPPRVPAPKAPPEVSQLLRSLKAQPLVDRFACRLLAGREAAL